VSLLSRFEFQKLVFICICLPTFSFNIQYEIVRIDFDRRSKASVQCLPERRTLLTLGCIASDLVGRIFLPRRDQLCIALLAFEFVPSGMTFWKLS
jgi:hypothetical protein